MELKVIAVVKPDYDWSVIVEISQSTLNKLTKTYLGSKVPEAGHSYNIAPIFTRLEKLEERERDAKQLAELLEKLIPKRDQGETRE